MKVLVLGSGAREHALVWKLAGERGVSELICAPGNGGTPGLAPSLSVALDDPEAILAMADREAVDLTIVGPELPLSLGVVDLFQIKGRLIVGPTRAAARLESSKAFAKDFMARHHIPTARYQVCSDASSALAILSSSEFRYPMVIKADGLAAGKGVVVATDRASAEAMIRGTLIERQFGDAGAQIVIEEFLEGTELSFFVLCDGERAVPLGSAQDYKRVFDGDAGPNTGGMGAISPSPHMTPALVRTISTTIVEPVLTGMRREGAPFQGVLYVGLMLTSEGPKVLEFNVRLGDPEAQVVLPGLPTDFLPLMLAVARGDLKSPSLDLESRVYSTVDARVGVVLASAGYPGEYVTGHAISGVHKAANQTDVLVFQAGTVQDEERLLTSGGRVLTIVGRGPDYAEAARRAYEAAAEIHFEGMQYRRDIGKGSSVLGLRSSVNE